MAPGLVDKMASRLHRMSHSSSEGKNESKETFTAREEEKARLCSWQADTKPLEVSEIIVDPQTKPVGHSSKLLRKDDFELIKTLGTGTFARLANQIFGSQGFREEPGIRTEGAAEGGCHSVEAGRTRAQRA
jgi:protein kinase A